MNHISKSAGASDAACASVGDMLGGNRNDFTKPTGPQQARSIRHVMRSGTAIVNLGGYADTVPPGPFGACAAALTALGLAVIPVGGADGKKPLEKWKNRRKLLSSAAIAGMSSSFSAANIGVITGPSGVTVVDCDAPEAVAAMIERCGDTPLKTATPSGGVHLWYHANGEHCSDLRQQGLAVDVKGIGGFVFVPPSIRPSGTFAGRTYRLQSGSWADLECLPTIRAGALPRRMYQDTESPTPLRAVKKGHRNGTLFRTLLRHALHCDTRDALQDVAETINGCCEPPLSPEEVEKTVASAWHHEQTDQNWVGREARTVFTAAELKVVKQHPHGADALLLLMALRLSHGARDGFCVVPKAMARDKVLPRWGKQRYRNASAALIQLGQLRITQRGDRRACDPRKYVFADVRELALAGERQGKQ